MEGPVLTESIPTAAPVSQATLELTVKLMSMIVMALCVRMVEPV